MNRFFNWMTEPKRKPREPVLMDNIASAEPASSELEQETKNAQIDLIQGLMQLGRRGAEVRLELTRATLSGRLRN